MFSNLSKIMNTTIATVNDPYEGLSVLEIKRLEYPRIGHTLIGLVLLCIGCFGFVENLMVFYVFAKTKHLRSATNMFIIGLSVCDFCMVVLGNPFPTTAALNGKWFAGEFFCYWEGFVVYFFGLSALYLLTAVSVDRYIVIAKPLKAAFITKRVAILAVLGCFAGGLLWSIFPFFGWSSYGLEAPGIYCGLHYEDTSVSTMSYVVAIFFMCFLIPLVVMAYCYYQVFMTVKHAARNTVWDMKSRVARKNLRIERKMLKTCFAMCAVYWCCWFPYAIVSFWTTFGDADSIPIALTAIPAVAAKSQVVWNPIIYVGTNKQFRKAFYAVLPCEGLRESLVKKEEVKEASSKESDLDDKTEVANTTKPNTNQVAPAETTQPTKQRIMSNVCVEHFVNEGLMEESLMKKEEVKEASFKDSDLDDKTEVANNTQPTPHTTITQSNRIQVAPAASSQPTKVEC